MKRSITWSARHGLVRQLVALRSTEVVTQSRQRSKKKSEKIVQVDASKLDAHGLTL